MNFRSADELKADAEKRFGPNAKVIVGMSTLTLLTAKLTTSTSLTFRTQLGIECVGLTISLLREVRPDMPWDAIGELVTTYTREIMAEIGIDVSEREPEDSRGNH